MTRLTITFLAAVLLFTNGQLTGTWTGSIGEKQEDGSFSEQGSAYLQLQQQADQITGSVGPTSTNAHAIEKASLSGDRLKFSTHYVDPASNETVAWVFDFTVHENSMEGTATGSRGDHSWTVEIRLSRLRS